MDEDRPGAQEWVPDTGGIGELREAVQGCRGCELWRDATQAVFGEGGEGARIMLVGEQPGDKEDRAGEPFIGPAGRILDQALEAAGIDRSEVYVTNAVKHFRFEERGKRRIHRRPDVGHIEACGPWLDAELDRVDASVLVCLGATAGRAVLGRPVKISAERGVVQAFGRRSVTVTVHPSAILRIRERDPREFAFEEFVRDLGVARDAVRRPAS
ncbi:UdgX family uracil-DNA binding protein [Microbacterium sp. CFH 90308]|uniref:Type-4 uracil-DNA glycosylase n=1 Tax=Microbacterium salsuginis TaxID=2722803 RepID=A0ABX1KDY5_9MICO|nr:UdgX family uracil-DNA binding protein [Microbacterium sp. CFH 90308]